MKKLTSNNFFFLAFSIVIHTLLAAYLTGIKLPVLNVPKFEIAESQLERTKIQLDEIKFVPRKEVLKKLAAIEQKQRQIVTTENKGKEEKPNHSRFLSEKNQIFDRQTIASKNGSFKELGFGMREVQGKEQNFEKPKSQKITKSQDSNQKISDKLKSIDMSDLAFQFKPTPTGISNREPASIQEEISDGTSKKEISQGSSQGDKSKVGLAANNDFIEDIPLGETTHLNTQEFKYFGFYNRIKLQLEQFWGKSINEKARALYRSGRRLPATENVITSVTVILNERGDIVSIKIDGSSGVRELDQAAVESFKKSGPLPNPPKGLVVDGKAVIQWGFVVRS